MLRATNNSDKNECILCSEPRLSSLYSFVGWMSIPESVCKVRLSWDRPPVEHLWCWVQSHVQPMPAPALPVHTAIRASLGCLQSAACRLDLALLAALGFRSGSTCQGQHTPHAGLGDCMCSSPQGWHQAYAECGVLLYLELAGRAGWWCASYSMCLLLCPMQCVELVCLKHMN